MRPACVLLRGASTLDIGDGGWTLTLRSPTAPSLPPPPTAHTYMHAHHPPRAPMQPKAGHPAAPPPSHCPPSPTLPTRPPTCNWATHALSYASVDSPLIIIPNTRTLTRNSDPHPRPCRWCPGPASSSGAACRPRWPTLACTWPRRACWWPWRRRRPAAAAACIPSCWSWRAA